MTAISVMRHIAADHPAFAGHFPRQPLLPGVLLLAEVMEVVRAQPELAGRIAHDCELQSAKFLAPVRPDSTITIMLRPEAMGLKFEIHRADTLVAKGQWAWALP